MPRIVVSGQPGSPGAGTGRLLFVFDALRNAEPRDLARARTTDLGAEEARLTRALETAAGELQALARTTSERVGVDVGAIFEAQALFACDPGIVGPALDAVRGGASAEEAIDRATSEHADRLAAVDDEYMRERAADLRDVGRRVSGLLSGRRPPELYRADGSMAILVAEDLDPSIMAILRPELVAGVVLSGGAANGHAAIVARALGMPLVLGVGDAVDASLDGAGAALDGASGRLVVEPDARDLAGLSTSADTPPTIQTRPLIRTGVVVAVEANVGSVREAEQAAAAGADGIGLVRTELLFLGRSAPPGLDEQRSTYRRIAAAMGGRPVVFRTLDVGGDKPAAWATGGSEPNPALGVRGIRLGLRELPLLETQLRALLEAVPGETLRVMLPMVATLGEIEAARQALRRAGRAAHEAGTAVAADVRLGIMIEVPAAAVMADVLAAHADFFSIGTNDLVQYTLAADRTNPGLAEIASPFQPAVLRLIAQVTAAATAHGRPVSVCGEAAANPAAAALFVGLGVTELSVAPAAIATLRSSLASLDPTACRVAGGAALAAGTVDEVEAIAEGLLERAAPGPDARAAAG